VLINSLFPIKNHSFQLASVNQEDAKVVFDAAHNYPYNKE
jgi:hypothetical protein